MSVRQHVQSAPYARLRRATGAGWIRTDFTWESMEPVRGRYRWQKADRVVAAAATAGVNVLAILGDSPRWAGCPPDADAYARFVDATAARYERGSAFWRARPWLPSVEFAIELWNEPYMSYAWCTAPNAAAYGKIALRAAETVRNHHRSTVILAAVDIHNFGDGSDWFADLLDSTPHLASVISGWAVHAYSGTCGPYASTTCSLKPAWRLDRIGLIESLAAERRAIRPVWVTELGWSTGAGGVTEAAQAIYLADALRRAVQAWHVAHVFVYTGERDLAGSTADVDTFGLYRSNGTAKPAVAALRRAEAAVAAASSRGERSGP
jgi:hypothetical protein